ncbi:uncharacterized protein LOC116220749 isoform X2 [Clupea harengus]|uniref:Uncharacterized protein LOC116220749 isoform X2 n=1 Tax=Clupea harengus TaxID=7950 RepID=A0A6P8FNM1_CLUHA|nr:uncharacterized protein LOC116220749 isoform X2 [Clupea harengus]
MLWIVIILFMKMYSQNGRMNIQRADGEFNLTIANISPSDEATYYCTLTLDVEDAYGNGTFLALKGFNHSFNEDRAFVCAVANCEQMNTEKKTVLNTEKAVDPVVYGLAAVLGLCFVLICYLVSLIYQDRNHKHDKDDANHRGYNNRDGLDLITEQMPILMIPDGNVFTSVIYKVKNL